MSSEKVFREWFMLDVRSGDPDASVRRLFAAGFEAFFPKHQSTALVPGHVLVKADPEQDESKLRHCEPDLKFVENNSNRPMCVPPRVALALRDQATTTSNTLCRDLAAMAPEYRMEFLKHWFHPAAIQS